MQLSDYAQALGQAQQLVPSWDEPDIRRAQLQGLQAQTQLQQQQAEIGQQEQADAQTFRTDLGALPRNPTAQDYRRLAAQHPRYFQQLSGAADKLEAGARQQTVSSLAQIGSAITANTPQSLAAAGSLIQRHIDADKAAGQQPHEDDVALLGMLNSGDPEQIRAAGVMVHGTLAALDDKAATAVAPDRANHFASTGDDAVYDQRTGDIVRQAPPKDTNAIQVPIYDDQGHRVGTQLVPNGGRGGGGQASGGGASNGSDAPAGRTVGGWTPRARNGGDNSDAAVDNKIAGSARQLGLDPTATFPAGMTNMQIARAMAFGEGGSGTLADRNNNPGNLTDPKTGAYRKFPTVEAGLAAMAAQVGRNRARGQNTVATMIEGLPVRGRGQGGAPTAAPGYIGPVPSAGGGADATGYVAGTDVGGMTAAAIDAAAGRYNRTGKLPPGLGRKGTAQQAILSRAAQLSGGQSAGSLLAGQAGTEADVKSLARLEGMAAPVLAFERTALHNGALALRTAAMVDNGGVPVFNRWVNSGRRNTGSGPVAAFDASIENFANEYAKVVSTVTGGGTTSDAAREHARSIINTAQSPEQLVSVMQVLAADMHNRRKGIETQRTEIVGRIRGGGQPTPQAAAPALPSGFRILSVRPK